MGESTVIYSMLCFSLVIVIMIVKEMLVYIITCVYVHLGHD